MSVTPYAPQHNMRKPRMKHCLGCINKLDSRQVDKRNTMQANILLVHNNMMLLSFRY